MQAIGDAQAARAEVPTVVLGPRDTGVDRPVEAADRAPDFADWVDRSGPGLLGFAHMITGSAHDAADAVQDALVAVYPRWRRLQRDDAAGRSFGADAYARRVIVNRSVSWWRKITRREFLVDAVELPPGRAPDAGEGDPAGAIGDAILARQLLATLPTRQRAAVVLRFYDDLAFAEIAAILRCTESTARSYVHRALAALRERLDDPASDADEVNR